MKISATEQPAAAQDQSAAAAAVAPRLTDEFLDTLTLAAIAMDGDDRVNGIAFTLACFEMAGKEPPPGLRRIFRG